MPNCSHSSLTVNRALCANITNRIISSIGFTFFQDIMLGTVTHHPGSFVTYHSGSHPSPRTAEASCFQVHGTHYFCVYSNLFLVLVCVLPGCSLRGGNLSIGRR